jgi:hypothetical protein
LKSYKSNNIRPVKGIWNNSATLSKDQIWQSWTLKKEKWYNQKEFII